MSQLLDVPCVLISSSSDLQSERWRIKSYLNSGFLMRGANYRSLLWEEETEGGQLLSAKSPVQLQIDELTSGRVHATVVMFAERIGFPLRGEPPTHAAAILEEWRSAGLHHPWPEDPAEAAELLDAGKFPLTGTVYELLVARSKEHPGELFIGYVADRDVAPRTTLDEIQFNQARVFQASAVKGHAPHGKFVHEEYRPQVQGLLNLLKALGSQQHAGWIQRFETAEAMYKTLGQATLETLLPRLPNRTGQLPFKGNMEHFAHDDPLPLPDRVGLRQKLKIDLVDYSRRGEMLVLEGPSGCGKSSLMQKGVLGELPYEFKDAKVIVFRPTDFFSRTEGTPLEKMLGLLCEELESSPHGIHPPLELRRPDARRALDRPAQAADSLGRLLETQKRNLFLGLDQFEELMDVIALEENQRDNARSTWQVLRFLGAALQHDRVYCIGTLEQMRRTLIAELKIRERIGLVIREEDADFPLGEVRGFLRSTTLDAGLSLSEDLVDDIFKMVEAFESDKAKQAQGGETASFLPLLGIWLYRFFVAFQDRMLDAEAGASERFGMASKAITTQDLRERDIAMTLGPLIGEIVEAAWLEAGQLPQEQCEVTDREAMFKAINQGLQTPQLRPLITPFLGPGNSFRLTPFLKLMHKMGKAIPGVSWAPPKDQRDLDNFLNALVALDRHGNMRLREIPRESPLSTMRALIDTFERRRLLVPTGRSNVRLVHQATVDNWRPARVWLERQKESLEAERRIRHLSAEIAEFDTPLAELLAQHEKAFAYAVRVLFAKKAVWSLHHDSSLQEQDEILRSFCIRILSQAEHGDHFVDCAGIQVSFVKIAAIYGINECIEKWLSKDKTLVNHEEPETHDTPLMCAAWGAVETVRLLKRHGAKSKPNKEGWRPVAAAIQTGRIDILQELYGEYLSPTDVIGPMGVTMLHEAARATSSAALIYLLQFSSSVDPRLETSKSTPLHFAAMSGRTAQINLLMEDCERTAADSAGQTALDHAILYGQADAVSAILDHGALTDDERDTLLAGLPCGDRPPMPAVVRAALHAQPAVLLRLLPYCDEEKLLRNADDEHALTVLMKHNHAYEGGAPLADRVAYCVRHLLDEGQPQSRDVAAALKSVEGFPNAARMLQAWLVSCGEFDGVSDSALLGWLTGSQLLAAFSVLRNVPGVLDKTNKKGDRGATLLICKGKPEVIAAALAEEILPTLEPELFRLEAAFRLVREGVPLPATREPLHPIISRIAADEAPELKALLKEMLPDSKSFRPLPHRLALRDEEAAFAAVVGPLHDGVPLDQYDRPPSALAPPDRRPRYRELESTKLRSTP
ncbi:ankyrin repeat domain-containing protein [Lignipirellula cremea]|uniref:Ankyrin repeats (3 copies) n=1 Tax=Lignipirellula cremea TaxID=2528010 RepID=A0A518DZB5_9BACT|nr:ankyrin repeat domain-containing protein [Lignipirellula cremea]QDU97187.1 Ankyrin repeats (3 copies) [Lignipirellula cremea]